MLHRESVSKITKVICTIIGSLTMSVLRYAKFPADVTFSYYEFMAENITLLNIY